MKEQAHIFHLGQNTYVNIVLKFIFIFLVCCKIEKQNFSTFGATKLCIQTDLTRMKASCSLQLLVLNVNNDVYAKFDKKRRLPGGSHNLLKCKSHIKLSICIFFQKSGLIGFSHILATSSEFLTLGSTDAMLCLFVQIVLLLVCRGLEYFLLMQILGVSETLH